MTKRIIASFLILSTLLLANAPAHHAKAEGTQALAIPEIESEVCCKTDTELMSEIHSTLLKKQELDERNEEHSSKQRSQVPFPIMGYSMPSTGNVKILVIPVAFPDYSEYAEKFNQETFYNRYFADYDPTLMTIVNTKDRVRSSNLDHSVRAAYHVHSDGLLDISGTILPVYMAPEPTTSYDGPRALAPLYREILEDYVERYHLNAADYDSDGDGYMDVVAFNYLCPNNSVKEGLWPMCFGFSQPIDFNGTKADNYMQLSSGIDSIIGIGETRFKESEMVVSTAVHEMGHLMGLPDNNLFNGVYLGDNYEVMASSYEYFNPYYRYLLGWSDPLILTIADPVEQYEVCLKDILRKDSETTPKTVVLLPGEETFPFGEYYMIEYRNELSPKSKGPAIVLWHANTELVYSKKDGTPRAYKHQNDYLKAVRKCGETGSLQAQGDFYTTGDIFSSDSQPVSSSFYSGDSSGAYMEVLDLTPEKAIIKAGFRDPDLSPPPMVEMSEPSPKAAIYKRYVLNLITIPFMASYKGESVSLRDKEDSLDYFELRCLEDGETYPFEFGVYFNKDPMVIGIDAKKDGTYTMTIKKGWITRSGKRSNEVTSEVFYIDNTPPEIKLQGTAPQIIECGEAYTELGAVVTDNLDPDIINGNLDGKFEIDASQVNTSKCGTYTVTYTATDHAGNETTVEREVIVQDTIAPTATVSYSTLAPTSGDVVATITPSEPVTVTNTENGSLSYTFTENGSFTFEFEDEAGNKGTATATVSNIDKSLPTGTVSYDITNPTNQDVTATLTVDSGITILNNGGSNTHVFTENGSFEFELQNAAGTKGTVAATVTWIDKEAPTATVTYSPHKLTNQDVTATITPSEEVIVTNNNGGLSHTFPENGSFTFEFEDKAGNKGTAAATVDWIDKEPPEITLLGDNPLSLKLGEEYEEPGVEVTDNRDEEIESKLEIDASAVDTEKAGTYTVKYGATDSAGNLAEATRTVKVVDPNASVPMVPTPGPELPFTDVSKGTWYYDPVSYAYNNGLFAGLTETEFGPDVSTSRAMLASILYRLEGKPEIFRASSFEDVPAGRYYSEAIAWAAEQGIVAGYDETHFGPDDSITREQLVSMLYRYAGSPETNGTLEKFTDSARASRYARPALCWAVETGILSGKGGGILDPKGKATRAEVASVLERYCRHLPNH